jgi:hypothetical protein
MNRRQFFGLGIRMAGAVGVAVTASRGEPKAWAEDAPPEDSTASDAFGDRNGTVNRAYEYLSLAMDATARPELFRFAGTRQCCVRLRQLSRDPRLPQSRAPR